MNYITNKTDVYYIDDVWSSDILDLRDCRAKSNRGFRYVFLAINNFSKFGCQLFSKKRKLIIKDSFENIFINSNRKPKLNETDEGSDFVNKIFTDLLKKKNFKNV